MKHWCRIDRRIKAPKILEIGQGFASVRRLFTKKWKFFIFLGPNSHPLCRLRWNFVQPSRPNCPSAQSINQSINGGDRHRHQSASMSVSYFLHSTIFEFNLITTYILILKFDMNRCNDSPLRGEKPDFWPVSKFNTGSLTLRGRKWLDVCVPTCARAVA